MVPATPAACCRRVRTWSRSVTNVLCLEAIGETRASEGPVLIRPRAWSVVVASLVRLRNSATRSGPLVCDACNTEWAWSMAPTPILATCPEAADRSWTERNCLPITGTMSSGARSGECSKPSAESNSFTADSSGAVAAWPTTSDADRCALACSTSDMPWLACNTPRAKTTPADTSHRTTTAPTSHQTRRLRLERGGGVCAAAMELECGSTGSSPGAGCAGSVRSAGSGRSPGATGSLTLGGFGSRGEPTTRRRRGRPDRRARAPSCGTPSSGPPSGSDTSSSDRAAHQVGALAPVMEARRATGARSSSGPRLPTRSPRRTNSFKVNVRPHAAGSRSTTSRA